ncbi:MAG: class I SAM-dependent methyltransferase [Candidatus Aureabacteria bacterium]|nr:class I SAM-dependent methyltransferase [Candidatus Auribacterota bacterium]
MEDTNVLAAKPFLDGTNLSVELAYVEIAIFSAIVASLPVGPGALILDLGAGSCWVSAWLRKLKYRTCSLDICTDMLRIGRRRMGPDSWVCTGDMAEIPLCDNSVDAVICYAALHHVPNWQQVLSEVHRVLRPGGVFVMQEPGRGHSKRGESIMQMEQFGVLEQELPPRLLVRACREAGFTRTIVRPVAELSHDLTRIFPPEPFTGKAPRVFMVKWLRRVLITMVEHLLNLWTTIHLVVAIKGTPYADSRRPYTMVFRFRDIDFPTQIRPSYRTPFRVSIENMGLTRWLADESASDMGGVGRVRLGISLLDEKRRIVDLDFLRVSLPRDIDPGETVELTGELPPFEHAGRAGFRLDMVSEGVFWFSDRGSKPRYFDVVIHE